jgi:hypothetical protein
MRLNSKVTWGLAWAGLAVVVAVPSLDFMTGKAGGKTAAVMTSTTDPVISAKTAPVLPTKAAGSAPVKTAAVTTKVTSTGISITPTGASATKNPVDDYLKANSSLPDYISNGPGSTDKKASDSSAPTQVATIDPTPPAVAPVPFPARPPDAVTTGSPSSTAAADTTGSIGTAPGGSPKIYAPAQDDEDVVPPAQEAEADPTGPVPPAVIDDGQPDWQGRGLQRYLSRNGLLDDGSGRSTASVSVVNRNDDTYDPNGFYLSDGPNDPRARRRARLMRMLDQEQGQGDGGWLPSFNLF